MPTSHLQIRRALPGGSRGKGVGAACQTPAMRWVTHARTALVEIESFSHDPGEPARASEWWPRLSLGFTTAGRWEVRSSRGSGVLDPATLLIGAGEAEHECRHPDGVDDRMLCVTYLTEADPGHQVALPVGARLHGLRRRLAGELARGEPDQGELDGLALALLAMVRDGGERARRPSARTRQLVGQLRHHADACYADPDFDFAAAASGAWLSRTRLVHAFRDVVGVTPHRYLTGLRLTRAARLLGDTSLPVTQICFDCGFGSLARFHAAFKEAFGVPPAAYRRRTSSR